MKIMIELPQNTQMHLIELNACHVWFYMSEWATLTPCHTGRLIDPLLLYQENHTHTPERRIGWP